MGYPASLKDAVDTITKSKAAKGTVVTEEEMAQKLGIPVEQFYAYLREEARPPLDLTARLNRAYGIGRIMGWSSSTHQPPEFGLPVDEAEISENERKGLASTMTIIKDRGKRKGMAITEEEMARKVGLSGARMQAYLTGSERTPSGLWHQLKTAYQPLLDAVQQEENRLTLNATIVKIRNLGLVAGRDITLEEMMEKMGITGEQLYDHLSGATALPHEVGGSLYSAYKDLIGPSGQVRVVEDVYLDEENRRVKLM